MLWHPSVSVKVLHKSLQHITAVVELPFVDVDIVITLVYGSNFRKERKQLWSELKFLTTSQQIAGLSWSVLGDFNQILTATEHSTSTQVSSTRGMQDFRLCLSQAELYDLPFCGNTYIWTNKHEVGIVAKKLDRILVNDSWLRSFPNSIGVFGEPGISDHNPYCVFLDSLKPKQKKPFKFFTHLSKHPDFAKLIEECWNSLNFGGTKMLSVSKRLKKLKSVIRNFSRDNYSDLEKRVT